MTCYGRAHRPLAHAYAQCITAAYHVAHRRGEVPGRDETRPPRSWRSARGYDEDEGEVDLQLAYAFVPVQEPLYEEPGWDAVVRACAAQSGPRTLLVPTAALSLLERASAGALFLCADRGSDRLADLPERVPGFGQHGGSFSLPVNFDVLGRVLARRGALVRQRRGELLHLFAAATPPLSGDARCTALALDTFLDRLDPTAVHLAARALASGEEPSAGRLLAALRLSAGDARGGDGFAGRSHRAPHPGSHRATPARRRRNSLRRWHPRGIYRGLRLSQRRRRGPEGGASGLQRGLALAKFRSGVAQGSHVRIRSSQGCSRIIPVAFLCMRLGLGQVAFRARPVEELVQAPLDLGEALGRGIEYLQAGHATAARR